MTAEFNIGQHIGDYEILSVLGLGGMGKVYKVRNLISDRVEAMKILLPDLTSHQSLADRFLREIRLLASLNHPNIASLRTALTHDNQLVMIMEFVEGETLANRLSRAPISTAEAVDYSDQILSALSYAHKQNIIHRDIKPANMMLTPQGVVKLMDFGIARSSSDGTLTSTGTTLGSLNYMPPEQVRGESADARSDIYSFGVSLYELLTGKLPFQGDSQYSLMTAHLNQVPAAPITMRLDLPPSLNEIILMAMAKDPAQRFQSADALRAALKSVPVSALPRSGTTVTSSPRAPSSSSETTLVETPPPSVSTAAMPAYTQAPSTKAQKPARVPPAPVPTEAAAQLEPPPPSSAPAPPRSSSSRGLWVAVGALAGVSAVIAAGIYIPRKVFTHADPNKSALPKTAMTTNIPATQDASSSAPVPNASAPVSDSGVSLQSDKGSIRVDPQGNVAINTPDSSLTASRPGDVKISGKRAGNPASSRDVTDRINTPTQDAQPAAPPVPAGPTPDEIAKVEDEADKLNIRGSTVSQSLETLRRQQQAAGYNLRGDIASSAERMQVYLSKGNSALKAQDLTNAKKYFDLADAEIAKLEKFLGH